MSIGINRISRRYVITKDGQGWETRRAELPVFGLCGVSIEYLGKTVYRWSQYVSV